MNDKNPFKFLDSYTKEDRDIYFGREKETEELYSKIRKSRLTLLYGLSGTGKTSLVQCGLANKFSDSDWFELYVRRSDNIMKSIRTAIDDHSETLIHPKTELSEALKIFYLDYFRPVYLLFDQFEELFISGSKEEQETFMSFIAEILMREDLNVKIILVMREEYFTHLDKFEDKIPDIFNSRMRLERMSNDTLMHVVENISKKGGISIDNKTVVLQQIIDNIANENQQVELPYLQVYLDKLNNLVEKSKDKALDINTVNKLGKLEDVLGDFLEEQVSEIEKDIKDKEMVWGILKMLITSEGTKQPVSLNDLISEYEKIKK